MGKRAVMEDYKHTQIGHLLILSYSGVILILGILMSVVEFRPFAIAGLVLITLALATSATLTVTVRDQLLTLRFGVGLIRKRFRIGEISAVRVVRNPWFYGWGARYTPRGWLYSVSGLEAVELDMRNGKHYRIGADTPHELAQAIEAFPKK